MRAEGLEPTRSLEHRHLKPACLPFHHARGACRSYRLGSPGNVKEVPTTRSRRFALILLVIVAAAGCLALGWWQWTRYESTSGNFQNLGYALQWPFFAGFCIYAYRKFVHYEQAPPQPPGTGDAITEIPAGLLPERPAITPRSDDPEMLAYNAYLAELADADHAAQDTDQDRTSA